MREALLFRWIVVLTALAVVNTTGTAWADPVLTFEWVGSGQIFAPTDSVEMKARVTNSGDMALIDANAFGNIVIFGNAPEVFDNYVEFLSGGFAFGPPGPFSIGTGESVEFTMATWDPFPITGNIGDPVPLGDYVVPNAAVVSLTYTTVNPFVQNEVDVSQAGDFEWTVSDTRPDPDPPVIPTPTAALAGLALLGVCGLRRRR